MCTPICFAGRFRTFALVVILEYVPSPPASALDLQVEDTHATGISSAAIVLSQSTHDKLRAIGIHGKPFFPKLVCPVDTLRHIRVLFPHA